MASIQNRFNFVKQEWNGFTNRMSGLGSSLNKSSIGRGVLTGSASAFGFEYKYGKMANGTKGILNRGFLGLRDQNLGYKHRLGYLENKINSGGWKVGAGVVGGTLLKGLGAAFTIGSIYSGFKEGGIGGAINEGAFAVGSNIAFDMAIGALGLENVMLPATVIAAAGYAGYKFGDAAKDYGKSLKRMEMGAPIADMFGTVATTRQRSLQALQNTHINGRMALGNEGMLLHTNVYSRR